MSTHTDFKFHPQVTQVGYYWGEDGHAEIYLLEGEQPVVIDTGCASSPEKFLRPALETLGYRLADIALILNTHGHYDHVSGNRAVIEASGAEVWLAEADLSVAQDFKLQFNQCFADRDLFANRPDRLAQTYADLVQYANPTPVHRYLVDGEVIDLGGGIRLRVIFTPGHSAGSVVLYWEEEGMLFTGDSVVGGGSRQGSLPLVFYPQQYISSLDRMLELDIHTLCIGHHYFSLTQPRGSVKYGSAGKTFIAESRQIIAMLRDDMGEIASAAPDAAVQDVIRQAASRISKYLDVTIERETGLPMRLGAAGTLRAIWQQYRSQIHQS
jgi:glyoxylase-like metal-dependent hydrolase (beta-lactamase superfamily II)